MRLTQHEMLRGLGFLKREIQAQTTAIGSLPRREFRLFMFTPQSAKWWQLFFKWTIPDIGVRQKQTIV